jgi:hypothetical protein
MFTYSDNTNYSLNFYALSTKHLYLRHVEQWLIRVETLRAPETTARGVYMGAKELTHGHPLKE